MSDTDQSNKIEGSYKKKNSFDVRKTETERIRKRYPDRIPILCEVSKQSKSLTLNKSKYLVPQILTVTDFLLVIRKRMNIRPEAAIFLYIRNELPVPTQTLGSIYDAGRDDDGFLYMVISGETTFGANQ